MFARGAPAHSVLRTQAGLAPSPRCRARAPSSRPSEVAAAVAGEIAVGVAGQGLDPGGEVLVQHVGRVVLADAARGSRR